MIETAFFKMRQVCNMYCILGSCDGTVIWKINTPQKIFSPTFSQVGISGTTAKSRKRKFVPSSHLGPFAVVALSRKSQTKVGTLAQIYVYSISR